MFPDKPDKYTRLLPVEESQLVMAEMHKLATRHNCSKEKAIGYATTIIRFFPGGMPKGDQNEFAKGLAAIFVHYPEDLVKKVVDPMYGIATKKEYIPGSLKAFKDALEERKGKVTQLQYAAWVNIEEHKRRKKQAEEDARLASLTPERRAENIARWEAQKLEWTAKFEAQRVKELEDRIAQDEARGIQLSDSQHAHLASLKMRVAMLQRDPQTVRSADDLLTPARPPSEELKQKAQQPLWPERERWV